MTTKTSHRRSKINQGLTSAPAGAVLGHKWLKSKGISPRNAAYYVTSGWLDRVGKGAYTLKSDAPAWLGAVFGLQQKEGTSIHPGGRTALELAGLAHFLSLGDQAPIYLFGRHGERLPLWLKRLPWAGRVRYVTSNFLPADLGLREYRTSAQSFTVRIATPERAILELLLQVTDEAGYEQARLSFEGLGTLRFDLVQTLLVQCNSVKAKRLFLHFADLHHHSWAKQLDLEKIDLGSGKRALVRGGRLDPHYLITVPQAAATPADAP
jgi:hypothetical protein